MGRLSLELCLPNVGPCISHGNWLLLLKFDITIMVLLLLMISYYFSFRLQLRQKMSGVGKNLEQEVEKQFTCSYITGIVEDFSFQESLLLKDES